MPQVSLRQLLRHAKRGRFPLACMSMYNLESMQAILAAAEEERAPVMLSIGNEAIAHAGLSLLGHLAVSAAREAGAPVSVHLNHGRSLEYILQALDLEFDSVMFDGSKMSFEENIVHTRRAAQLAHESDALIEGELGSLRGSVQGAEAAGILDLALRFVEETEVDMLAVSIPGEGAEDLGVLHTLVQKLPVPLAIHGASRLGPDGVEKLSRLGVGKVNFHSEIKKAMSAGLAVKQEDSLSRFAAARHAITTVARQKIVALGASQCLDPDSMLLARGGPLQGKPTF